MSKEIGTNGGIASSTSCDIDASDANSWQATRRDFLRMVGAGAGAVTLASLTGCGGSNATAAVQSQALRASLAAEEAFWIDVKRLFALNPDKTFMNIGTAGSMPRRVLDYFEEANLNQARESLNGYGSFANERRAIAPGFGVDPDEIVISGNTSDGMNHAIGGIDWQKGDVIITTNHEHPGGDVPMQIAADRYGLEIVRVALPVGTSVYLPSEGGTTTHTAQTYVNLFDKKISEIRAQGKRVRAMVWSAPTYKTGTLLPIRKLVQLAIQRSVANDPIITVVDGAHLPGMMNLNYAEQGMDFMAGAAHKWQCGPGSTGILIVRNKVRASNTLPLPRYFPVVTSSYSTVNSAGVDWHARATGPTETYDIAATIQSCGSKHAPLIRAAAEACAMWDEMGRDKIETYTLSLSKYLKQLIIERWGVNSLYSPDEDELACALTSFSPFLTPSKILDRDASSGMVAALAAKGFVVRNVNVPIGHPDAPESADHWPLRISTHLWQSVSDIDRLVDAMWEEARNIG